MEHKEGDKIDINKPLDALKFIDAQLSRLNGDRQFHAVVDKAIATIERALTTKPKEKGK